MLINIFDNPTLGVAVIGGVFMAWGGLCTLAGTMFMSWRNSATQVLAARVSADVAKNNSEQQALSAASAGDKQFYTSYLGNMQNLANLWEKQVMARDVEIADLTRELLQLRSDYEQTKVRLAECERKWAEYDRRALTPVEASADGSVPQ